MNRGTSLYLDVVRFAAALTVFLGHMAGDRFTGGFLWPFSLYMGEAVVVFFVLSGFVIGYAADRQQIDAGSYAVARLARVYSVALPALVATFVLDALGVAMRPDLYSSAWGYAADGKIWQFVSGALFLNRLWFLAVPQGSDLPFWSLGYEVWYYVLFGVAAYVPGWRRWPALAAVLAVAGPPMLLLFPLWLLGWLTYRLCARMQGRARLGALLCLGPPAAWMVANAWLRRHEPLALPSWEGWDLARAYLVAGAFAIHLIGIRVVSPWIGPALEQVGGPDPMDCWRDLHTLFAPLADRPVPGNTGSLAAHVLDKTGDHPRRNAAGRISGGGGDGAPERALAPRLRRMGAHASRPPHRRSRPDQLMTGMARCARMIDLPHLIIGTSMSL